MTKVADDDTTPPTGGAPEPVNRLFVDNAARAFHAASPLPAVPPEWVPLAELPGWVACRYGVPTHVFAGELVLAVRRRSELRHRIHISPNRNTGRLPHGLDASHDYPKRTVVVDWETAEADWTQGTVLVIGLGDGTKLRLPIEVFWEDVEPYVSARLRRWTLKPPDAAAQTPKTLQIAAAEVASVEPGVPSGKPLPPFDAKGAMGQLAAKKVAGGWAIAPSERVTKEFLLQLYDTVPRAPHRKIRRDLWPNIRRGPPSKQRPGEIATRKH